jgi:hypothetical protein
MQQLRTISFVMAVVVVSAFDHNKKHEIFFDDFKRAAIFITPVRHHPPYL